MAEPKAAKTTKHQGDNSAVEQFTLDQVAELFDGLPAEAILAFKDYGAYVVVVTTNGQKLQADKHD